MAQFSASINLSSLNGSNGFRMDGDTVFGSLGSGVSSAGDINGDGFDDVIVGASGPDKDYVVFGKASGFSAAIDLSALDGSDGFVLDNVASNDGLGIGVSGAGDVNGDGIDDLIVGANYADPGGVNGAGSSYVVFGKTSGFSAAFDLSSLDGTDGFRIDGINVNDFSGRPVGSAGDINGDGFDDVMVGAFNADPGAVYASGEAYVVFGKASGFSATVAVSALDGSDGFRVNGASFADRLGYSVSSAGDLNGDGFDDIIIGARDSDLGGTAAGSSFVIFGKASGFSADFLVSGLDGTNGFRLDGIDSGDGSGRSVSSAGDVNGDGFADIIIGARNAAPGGNSSAGESYVVFGQASGFAAASNLSTLNGTNGFRLDGITASDFSGNNVSSAGDVNGDGFDDILISAEGGDPGAVNSAGESYVVFGKSSAFGATFDLSTLDGDNGFQVNGIDVLDSAGRSASGAGDVNGDGFDDIIIGATGADPGSVNYAGESYVVFGVKETVLALNLVGAAADQTMLGGTQSDTISGLGGNDTLIGFEGDDTLNGGLGDDTLDGGANGLAGDTADYSDAMSSIRVFLADTNGQNTLGSGRDTHIGIENLLGSDFDDSLYGDAGDNVLEGGDGADRLVAGDGNDTLRGGAGDDILKGRGGDDMLFGDGGSDILFADAGVDELDGGADNDFLYGGSSNDVLIGGTGDDRLRGNLNNDTMNGGDGADLLFGGGQNDMLFGDAGDDNLDGENGIDTINGGSGDDVLRGGTLADTFVFEAGNEIDRVRDWEDGIDMIDLTSYGFADKATALTFFSEVGSNVRFINGPDTLIIENEVLLNITEADILI